MGLYIGELKKKFPVDLRSLCLDEQHNVLVCPGGYIKRLSVALCLLAMCFSVSIDLKSCLHFIMSVVLGVGAPHRRRRIVEADESSYPLGTCLAPSLHLHKHKQGIS